MVKWKWTWRRWMMSDKLDMAICVLASVLSVYALLKIGILVVQLLDGLRAL